MDLRPRGSGTNARRRLLTPGSLLLAIACLFPFPMSMRTRELRRWWAPCEAFGVCRCNDFGDEVEVSRERVTSK